LAASYLRLVKYSLALVLVTHPQHHLASYFGDEALRRLNSIAEIQLNAEATDLSGQALIEAAQECDVVIAYRQTPFEQSVLQALPKLKAVVRCAVDIRTIDVAAASACGILVTQASPGFQAAVSEWIVGVMIDLSRGISNARAQYQQQGTATASMGRELRGATLGIIGYGEISRYLCPVAHALGMRIVVTDPFQRVQDSRITQANLFDVVKQSDYLVCLATANAQTENLIDANCFAQMKRGSFFINASRGNLLGEAALLAALESGHVAGAAIDVGRAADQMPSPALASHALVIATPHIGGLTPTAIEHQALETVAQTAEILKGRVPKGSVNAQFASRLTSNLAG
jgi:D-3-phosphoglycerate dehydrogenase / 2-oxoglutarate reductase